MKSTFALLLAGMALALPASAQVVTDGETLKLENCELLVPGTPLSTSGQCGWLKMPENPADPEGRQIDIHVARIPARGRVTEPDPLVFFAGGPGQAATESWPIVARALNKVTESRDVLLVDQRGTGQSNPMKCPQVELEDAMGTDWEQLAEHTRDCLAAMDGDPRFYTTTIAMADVDAAREALGYEKVNLYGGSYGTRAAQVYYRLFPQQVRTIILDGVVPQTLGLGTEHAVKLDQAIYRVLDGCEADSECSSRFPGTPQKLRNLIRFSVEQPAKVTVDHPTTGEPFTLTFNQEVLASALRFLTYSPETQAMLPMLIHEAATENRFDRLASQMLITAAGLQQSIAHGMEMSVMCAEDFPMFQRDPQPNDYLLGNLMEKVINVQCGIWPKGPVPDDFHEPVTGDVPVLLLSGEYDPVTPPEYAEQVAAHFDNAMHLVAPGQGHIAVTRGCMGDIASTFITDAGTENIESDCLSQMQPSPFFQTLTGPTP